MELKTLCAIFAEQLGESSLEVSQLISIAGRASQLVNQENSVADVNQQVKSLMASATIQMQALNSQNVLVQQTIDKILEIVNVAS